jgi:hypothetical protein
MRSGALPVAAPSSALPSIFIVLPPLPSANVPESFAGEPPFRFNTAFSYVKGSLDAAEVDAEASRLADPISFEPSSSSSSKLIDALDAARVANVRRNTVERTPLRRMPRFSALESSRASRRPTHWSDAAPLARIAHRDADRIECVVDALDDATPARAHAPCGVDVAVTRASDDIGRLYARKTMWIASR